MLQALFVLSYALVLLNIILSGLRIRRSYSAFSLGEHLEASDIDELRNFLTRYQGSLDLQIGGSLPHEIKVLVHKALEQNLNVRVSASVDDQAFVNVIHSRTQALRVTPAQRDPTGTAAFATFIFSNRIFQVMADSSVIAVKKTVDDGDLKLLRNAFESILIARAPYEGYAPSSVVYTQDDFKEKLLARSAQIRSNYERLKRNLNLSSYLVPSCLIGSLALLVYFWLRFGLSYWVLFLASLTYLVGYLSLLWYRASKKHFRAYLLGLQRDHPPSGL